MSSCYTRTQKHSRCKGSVAGWITSIWQGGSTQRQARELISCPSPTARARHFSFNRTQSRVGICLLTGHNTLRRHLHVMGLKNIPLCRRREAADETSARIFCKCEALASLKHVYLGPFSLDPENTKSLICECEALASLKHVYLGPFSLDPENIKSLIWGPSGTLAKNRALLNGYQIMGDIGPVSQA